MVGSRPIGHDGTAFQPDVLLRDLLSGWFRRRTLLRRPSCFPALATGDAGFFGGELVSGSPSVSGFAPFAAGDAGFCGGEFMGGAASVSGFAALAAGLAGFVGTELVRRSLLMRGFAASTRNFSLLDGVHRGEPSSALGKFGHGVFLLVLNKTTRNQDPMGRNVKE